MADDARLRTIALVELVADLNPGTPPPRDAYAALLDDVTADELVGELTWLAALLTSTAPPRVLRELLDGYRRAALTVGGTDAA